MFEWIIILNEIYFTVMSDDDYNVCRGMLRQYRIYENEKKKQNVKRIMLGLENFGAYTKKKMNGKPERKTILLLSNFQ